MGTVAQAHHNTSKLSGNAEVADTGGGAHTRTAAFMDTRGLPDAHWFHSNDCAWEFTDSRQHFLCDMWLVL